MEIKTKLIGIFLSLLILITLFFNKNETLIFGKIIDKIFSFSIRDWIINFINKNYSKESSAIILITAFGYKNQIGINLYKLFIDLSISHLIVVSGYHLSYVKKIFDKIIKNEKIKLFLLLFLLIIFNYNLDFNFGIFRASIFLLLMRNRKNDPIQMLSLSGIIILFFCPYAILNYSFLMSYLSSYLIILLSKKFNNIFLGFIIPIFINILLFPLISQFTKFISITGIIFSFFYSNIFCILFLFNSFLFWFTFLDPFFCFLFNSLEFIIMSFISFNFKIDILKMNFNAVSLIYLLFFFYLERSYYKNNI